MFAYLGPLLTTVFENLPGTKFIDYFSLLWLSYTLNFMFAYLGPFLTTIFEDPPTHKFIFYFGLLWHLYCLNFVVAYLGPLLTSVLENLPTNQLLSCRARGSAILAKHVSQGTASYSMLSFTMPDK